MIDQRNAYGFPVPSKLDLAKQYAEEAKERNKPQCECDSCREKELLPAVIRITERWLI